MLATYQLDDGSTIRTTKRYKFMTTDGQGWRSTNCLINECKTTSQHQPQSSLGL